MTDRRRHRAQLLLVCGLAALAPACHTGTVFDPYADQPQRSSRFVGQETLDLIVPGETTAEWIERRLGKPTTSEPMFTSAKKLWRYEYEKIENRDGTTYRILEDGWNGRRIARAIHFEISAGVVDRWWIE
ncbi:MAG: hypothetical protein ACF8QF_04135 [Phycisphaerales bacterium]